MRDILVVLSVFVRTMALFYCGIFLAGENWEGVIIAFIVSILGEVSYQLIRN